jgi:hypothetical protein
MPFDPSHVEPPDPHLVAALRAMTTEQRLAIAARMWRGARDAIRCLLTAEHPDWTPDQIQAETARRMLHGAV